MGTEFHDTAHWILLFIFTEIVSAYTRLSLINFSGSYDGLGLPNQIQKSGHILKESDVKLGSHSQRLMKRLANVSAQPNFELTSSLKSP